LLNECVRLEERIIGDVMPANLCEELQIPAGSTYADGVKADMFSLDEVTLDATSPAAREALYAAPSQP
jgi:hypothetical protein